MSHSQLPPLSDNPKLKHRFGTVKAANDAALFTVNHHVSSLALKTDISIALVTKASYVVNLFLVSSSEPVKSKKEILRTRDYPGAMRDVGRKVYVAAVYANYVNFTQSPTTNHGSHTIPLLKESSEQPKAFQTKICMHPCSKERERPG